MRFQAHRFFSAPAFRKMSACHNWPHETFCFSETSDQPNATLSKVQIDGTETRSTMVLPTWLSATRTKHSSCLSVRGAELGPSLIPQPGPPDLAQPRVVHPSTMFRQSRQPDHSSQHIGRSCILAAQTLASCMRRFRRGIARLMSSLMRACPYRHTWPADRRR